MTSTRRAGHFNLMFPSPMSAWSLCSSCGIAAAAVSRTHRSTQQFGVDATRLAMDMASSGDSLLHGDLHPGNILRLGNGPGVVTVDRRPCLVIQRWTLPTSP